MSFDAGHGSERGRSLRRRVVLTASAAAMLVVAAQTSVVLVGLRLHDQLVAAGTALVVEQRIADDINAAVMQQLALTSAFPGDGSGDVRLQFIEAGEYVHETVRQYLFRDLSADERLQLETVRTQHQLLETAAIRAADQYARGRVDVADASMNDVVAFSQTFVDAFNRFMRLREQDVRAAQEQQEATYRRLNVLGAGVTLLAVLMILGLAIDFRRRVGGPLAELAAATERMAGGDLTARVSPGPDQELRVLGEAFNRMARNLEHATGALEERNEELVAALDRVHAAQAELIESEKLSAIGRMTAGFAHEMNNPLASVVGFAQLLDECLAEDSEPDAAVLREEFVAPILHQAERARRLASALLRTSRRSTPHIEPVPLRGIVDVVHTLRAYAFDQAGLRFERYVPDVWVMAEPQMLQSVLLNLANNALDAMGGQGRGVLTVQARRTGDAVDIVFEDEGPGFEQLDRVFEPFFTTKPVGQGTGLGLPLVHQLVASFGGSVVADNRPEGGARVTIRLRAAEAPEATHAEAPAARTETARSAPTASVSDDDAETVPPRILVVEDEAPLRRLQERILSRTGAEVFLAASVPEAREVLRKEDVDLIVSDLRMPGESGLDLFEWVRNERPELKDRVLFVTGDVSDPELAMAAEGAAHRLLRKPFEVTAYLAWIEAALE